MVMSPLTTGHRGLRAHVLGRGDFAAVRAVLDADPVAGCMVAARVEEAGMDRLRLGGSFWGVDHGRRALAFLGPNLVVLAGHAPGLAATAEALGRRHRSCASVTGRAEFVLELWPHLAESWGRAREIRSDQPLLTCAETPRVPADHRVVPVGPAMVDSYFPAAVAMFREEVGSDPLAADGGAGYRSRVESLLAAGRAFALRIDDTIVYKAEIGALSRRVALIQGVWVHPAWRGRGIAAPATAAVVRAVHRAGRVASLYVNAHNLPACATYARIGFRRVGTFASVLF